MAANDPSRPAVRSPGRAGRWLALRVRAVRAFSLPVSVLPVLAATAAAAPVRQWRWGVLAASALGAAAMHVVGNLLNDYFDFRKGVDRRLEDDAGRPGRLLIRGELTSRDVLLETAAFALVSLLPGAYLLWQGGWGVLPFAALGGGLLYAYTGPPLALKYRGLGELTIFLAFGPLLMLGAAWVQTGRIEWVRVGPLSVAAGFATTAILVGNNIRDAHEDRQAGVTTLVQLAGTRLVGGLYLVLVVASAGGLAAMAGVGMAPWPLVASPLLLGLLVGPIRAILAGRRLPDIDARTARFAAALLAFVFLAYLLT